jgi:hypothetical protein
MRFGVMITNGPGGHPSWKHAEVTADKLIVDPLPSDDPTGAKTEAASVLRKNVRDMIEAHHEKVKGHELDQLKTLGVARHAHPLEPEKQHLDDAVAEIVKLTKGTALEDHYAKPDVQSALRQELAVEFRTQQYIHRREYANATPAKVGA